MSSPCGHAPIQPETCTLCRQVQRDPLWFSRSKAERVRIVRTQNGLPPTPSVQEPSRKIGKAIHLPCIHEGKSVPPPPDKRGNGRSYLECEAGKGVVCKCECNRVSCNLYTPDTGEPEYKGEVVVENLQPKNASESWPVAWMKESIRFHPPGSWPSNWHTWPNTRAAHVELLHEHMKNVPSPVGAGRGIVVCVSAKPGNSSGKNLEHGHLPSAWVLVHELRRYGCNLPITFAHLGTVEWDASLTELVQPLGVEVIDLREWERAQGGWRILAGWETKIAAVYASPYREVMFLDADNQPVRNPEYMFETSQYREAGAVFWPDLPPNPPRKEWVSREAYASVGLSHPGHYRDFESGQFMVDKSRCGQGLWATRFLNEHSDYYYKLMYGDKTTFHLGFLYAGQPYAMPDRAAGWDGRDGSIVQYDFNGSTVFRHLCQNKPTMNGYPRGGGPSHAKKECLSHLESLRSKWDGRLWAKSTLGEESALGVWKCNAGKGGLESIEFLPGGRVGTGISRSARYWSVSEWHGVPTLAIGGDGRRAVALLTQSPDGWRGVYLDHPERSIHLHKGDA